jgi:hypothetical protein
VPQVFFADYRKKGDLRTHRGRPGIALRNPVQLVAFNGVRSGLPSPRSGPLDGQIAIGIDFQFDFHGEVAISGRRAIQGCKVILLARFRVPIFNSRVAGMPRWGDAGSRVKTTQTPNGAHFTSC